MFSPLTTSTCLSCFIARVADLAFVTFSAERSVVPPPASQTTRTSPSWNMPGAVVEVCTAAASGSVSPIVIVWLAHVALAKPDFPTSSRKSSTVCGDHVVGTLNRNSTVAAAQDIPRSSADNLCFMWLYKATKKSLYQYRTSSCVISSPVLEETLARKQAGSR